MRSKITPIKPALVILYGFPGSGKSTFARQFTQLVSSVHLQADKVSAELFGGHETVEHDKLSKYLTRQFLAADMSVVYDGNVARRVDRRALLELARSSKVTPVLVWLQIDPDTAFARTEKRDRRKIEGKFAKTYTKEAFEEALARQQNPEPNQHYVVISGKHTFNTQFSAVLKKLSDLGVVNAHESNQGLVKPDLVNNVPYRFTGRVDMERRNISIR